MKRWILVLSIVALCLVPCLALAQPTQSNLGGPISPLSLKATYENKLGSGSATYETLVTASESFTNPYLYVVFNPSTGEPEKIYIYAFVNGNVDIIGCTPWLVANKPPKTGLTFQVQGMAVCTFCPESGVAGVDQCNNSSETNGNAYLALSGTAYMDNRTDEIITKMVLKGTTGGGGFQYQTSDNVEHNAVFTGTFGATLEPMSTPP